MALLIYGFIFVCIVLRNENVYFKWRWSDPCKVNKILSFKGLSFCKTLLDKYVNVLVLNIHTSDII